MSEHQTISAAGPASNTSANRNDLVAAALAEMRQQIAEQSARITALEADKASTERRLSKLSRQNEQLFALVGSLGGRSGKRLPSGMVGQDAAAEEEEEEDDDDDWRRSGKRLPGMVDNGERRPVGGKHLPPGMVGNLAPAQDEDSDVEMDDEDDENDDDVETSDPESDSDSDSDDDGAVVALPYPCQRPGCNLTYATATGLDLHLASTHNSDPATRLAHVCDICRASYANRSRLRNHRRRHTDPVGDDDRLPVPGGLICPIPGCGKDCVTRRNRQDHLANKHSGWRLTYPGLVLD